MTLLHYTYLALCAAVAAVPLLERTEPPRTAVTAEWPAFYEGAPLHAVPIPPAEQGFYARFPGAVARFTDGRREFVIRRVAVPTRKLHSSAHCFRGLGYSISEPKPELDAEGRCWSSYTATRDAIRLRIRERISSETDAQSWTDVSAWYWSALLRSTRGPWLAITIAEPEP